MRRCGCAGTRNGERATFRQDFSGLGRPSIPRASPRIASEWATIRELSHGGSNRKAEGLGLHAHPRFREDRSCDPALLLVYCLRSNLSGNAPSVSGNARSYRSELCCLAHERTTRTDRGASSLRSATGLDHYADSDESNSRRLVHTGQSWL